jgi:hypothetical protein
MIQKIKSMFHSDYGKIAYGSNNNPIPLSLTAINPSKIKRLSLNIPNKKMNRNTEHMLDSQQDITDQSPFSSIKYESNYATIISLISKSKEFEDKRETILKSVLSKKAKYLAFKFSNLEGVLIENVLIL